MLLPVLGSGELNGVLNWRVNQVSLLELIVHVLRFQGFRIFNDLATQVAFCGYFEKNQISYNKKV